MINELGFFMEWNENGMCKVLGLDVDPRMPGAYGLSEKVAI